MNTYICIWKKLRIEVHADTTYAAQKEAHRILLEDFRKKIAKRSDITVILAAKNSEEVAHVPVD